CALNSAVYRFLVTAFIVVYSFISWSRIFAHLTHPSGMATVLGASRDEPVSLFHRLARRSPLLQPDELHQGRSACRVAGLAFIEPPARCRLRQSRVSAPRRAALRGDWCGCGSEWR